MRRKSRAAQREGMSWDKLLLLIIVILSTLVIMVALAVPIFGDPVKNADAQLQKMAGDYYVNYLYKKILGGSDNPSEVMSAYKQSGIPTIYLRQFLAYNKNNDKRKYFDNEYYQCDTNKTGVRYFPVEPYGAEDYTMDVYWNCEKLFE